VIGDEKLSTEFALFGHRKHPLCFG